MTKCLTFLTFSLWLFATAVLVSAMPGQVLAMELVMFEQEDCEWCEAWDKDISGVYPKTAEGKQAPLRRVDIFDKRPADLKDLRAAHYTPTFVLMDKGKEVGRIRGYPGEDFFWGMLGQLIEKAKKNAATASSQKPAS